MMGDRSPFFRMNIRIQVRTGMIRQQGLYTIDHRHINNAPFPVFLFDIGLPNSS